MKIFIGTETNVLKVNFTLITTHFRSSCEKTKEHLHVARAELRLLFLNNRNGLFHAFFYLIKKIATGKLFLVLPTSANELFTVEFNDFGGIACK